MSLLLFAYLTTEILAPLFASLAILSCVLYLGKLVPFLDTILSFGVGFADFIRLCAYISPMIFLFAIPMATMMGVILAFTRLVHDREVTAFMAGGIGVTRMVPPVLVVALCASVLTFIVSTHLQPVSHTATKKLLFHLAKQRVDRSLQEKSFSDSIKDLVLYIDQIDKDTGVLKGIMVSDLRDPDVPVTIFAREGRLLTNPADMTLSLTLHQGSLHRALALRAQAIRFATYSLFLPMETPKDAMDASSEPGKHELGQMELVRRAQEVGVRTSEGIALLIKFHQRLVLPAGCFILGILGLPLALRTGLAGRSMGLTMGLGLFVLYYALFAAARAVSANGVLPVGLVMWTPNAVFAVLSVYLLFIIARDGIVVGRAPAGRMHRFVSTHILRQGRDQRP